LVSVPPTMETDEVPRLAPMASMESPWNTDPFGLWGFVPPAVDYYAYQGLWAPPMSMEGAGAWAGWPPGLEGYATFPGYTGTGNGNTGTARTVSRTQERGNMSDERRTPFLERGNLDVVAYVRGNVWPLSRQQQGCREVQAALDKAKNNEERSELASELRDHVWEAMKCPNANYVLQKCIITLGSQQSQFIIDELMCQGPEAVVHIAEHRFGCRIVLRLLEHCTTAQVRPLVDILLRSVESLCMHAFGNYVVQHLFDYGTRDQTRYCYSVLSQRAREMGQNSHACAVLTKALACHADHQVTLARNILAEQDLVVSMACNRHGSVAVKHMLQNLKGTELKWACMQLSAHEKRLRQSRYGRLVLPVLQEMLERDA